MSTTEKTRPSNVPFVQNVTGKRASDESPETVDIKVEDGSPQSLVDSLVSPVKDRHRTIEALMGEAKKALAPFRSLVGAHASEHERMALASVLFHVLGDHEYEYCKDLYDLHRTQRKEGASGLQLRSPVTITGGSKFRGQKGLVSKVGKTKVFVTLTSGELAYVSISDVTSDAKAA